MSIGGAQNKGNLQTEENRLGDMKSYRGKSFYRSRALFPILAKCAFSLRGPFPLKQKAPFLTGVHHNTTYLKQLYIFTHVLKQIPTQARHEGKTTPNKSNFFPYSHFTFSKSCNLRL